MSCHREIKLEDDERVDLLREGLWIVHRERGHRATTDDQLLAWAALDELARRAQGGRLSILELGMGKATVSLWLSSGLSEALFFGLEAFEQSYALSLKNRQLNQLDSRIFPLHADLRNSESWSEVAALRSQVTGRSGEGIKVFQVVLGAPPFMPLGSGVLPQDAQRASGRFELKGGVEAYLRAAEACLAPEGFAVILMDGLGEQRAIKAVESAGLRLLRLLRVKPRPAKPTTYCLLFCERPALGSALTAPSPEADSLVMRDLEGGDWSAEYQEVRELLGLS